MKYIRPKSSGSQIARAERRALLEEYFAHYSSLVKQNPAALNRKVSRKAFEGMLDSVGELLLRESAEAARRPGPARDFLDQNPLPPLFADKLPDDFRMFCLALNALKQWVAAEQAATDRYVLGATARNECRAVATTCVLSGEQLSGENTDLHHTVRDGRPPIPLSKKAHAAIEGQLSKIKRSSVASDDGSLTKGSKGIVTYRSSRLLFRADVIEPLADDERFRVEAPDGDFEMTKADFYHAFGNVASSASYQSNGIYSYSKLPKKALPFRLKNA